MHGFAKTLLDYQRHHSNKMNNLMHQIGIPLTLLGTLIFLGWFQFVIFGRFHVSFAWISAIALAGFYLYIDLKIGAACSAALLILTILAGIIGTSTPGIFGFLMMLIFTGGGIAMLMFGHQKQGDKPRPQDYVYGVLTGPFVIMSDLKKKFDL